jgi:enoyl-CoA hydratase/carnithine racemase
MKFEDILYDVKDGIATVTLNRPDKLNAWSRTMNTEVRQAMTRAGEDEAVRVIIMTGQGRGFCSGADMNLLSGLTQNKSGERERVTAEKQFEVPFPRRADFMKPYSYLPGVPKPIIAAINGPCAGLGLVIALYCDLRFAAREASFTSAFARRGLIAEHGISWLLPQLVGTSHALDLLVSARKVSADEALQMGLVNRLYPVGDLMAQTRAYARDLASNVSPRSMGVVKRQVWEAHFQTLKEAVEIGDEEMKKSFASADFKEGVAHFVEKRPARFTGK